MAKIALRAYNQEIESLIDARQIDEAIAHCRHILKTFPKHIQSYRLLGKAFLESQRYADAGDILGRVLSSIPDDFIAHVGMSVIREDEGNLTEAIYHMERAFEVQPANKAIQEELRRLYGRRDGFAPPKVRLSRGALARMYARGELYPQAIAELRAALAENPDRLDLRLLLARNYMRMGQRVEAVDACNLLLRKIPYCLEANQIMANVLQNSERAADAAAYRRRVAALDPYEAHVSPLIPDASRVPDGTVTVERLSWQPGMPLVAGDYQPEWAASLGVHVPEEYPGLDEFPDWLGGAEKPAAKGPALVEDDGITPIKDETAEAAEAEELPEWMQQAGWKPGTGDAKEGPVFFDDESEDLLAGAEELSGLPEAELPDWVREMAPPAAQVAATQADEWISETSLSETSLSETSPGESPVDAEAGAEELGELLAGVQEPAETPEWLSELGDAQSGAEKTGPEADLAETALLGSMRAAQAAAPELGDIEGDTDSEAIPDWLAEAGTGGEDASDEVSTWLTEAAPEIVDVTRISESIEAAEGGLPDWLSTEAEYTSPADALRSEDEAEEAVPDWLSAEPEFSSPADRLQEEEAPAAEELPEWQPEWLKAARSEALEEAPAEAETPVAAFDVDAVELEPAVEAEIPDWLKGVAAAGVAAGAAAAAESWQAETEEPAAEAAPDEELPDWFKAAQTEAPVETTPEAETAVGTFDVDAVELEPAEEAGIPDWLKAVQAEASAETPAEVETPLAAFGDEAIEIEPAEEAELPDWLKAAQVELSAEAEVEAVEIEPAAEAEIPDWLKEAQVELSAEAEPEAEAVEIEPAAEAEIPDWLKAAQVELSADAEVEAVAIEPAAEADIPDWLKGAPAAGVPEAGVPAAGMAAAGELESWQAESEQPEAEAAQAEELPDWLMEARAAGETASEATEPAAFEEPEAETATAAEEELPEWLVEAEAEETAVEMAAEAGLEAAWEAEAIEIEPTAEAEIPDWLMEARASEERAFEPTEAEAAPETEPGAAEAAEKAELPDWLAALETPVEEGDTKPGRTMLATSLEILDAGGDAEQPPVEEAAQPGEAGVFMADEIPDWMREMAPAGTALDAEVEATEDDFASLFGEAEALEAEELAVETPAEELLEAETPAWAVEALTEATTAEELAAEAQPGDESLAEDLAIEELKVEELAVDELAAEELAVELPAAGLAEAETEEIEGELIAAGLTSAGLAAAAVESTAQSEEDEFMSLFAAEEETTARTLDLEQVEAEEVEAELLVEEVAPELVEPDEAAAGVLAGEVAAASELEAEAEAAAPEALEEEVAEASVFAELDAMASTEHGRGFGAGAEAEMEAAEAEAAPPTAELQAVEGEVELPTAELPAAGGEFELPGTEPAAEEIILEPQEAQSPEITAAAAEMPDFGDDMEAAFAWLEGLAARQGATEALFTAPEDRPEAPPEWVASAVEEIPAAEAAPEAVEAEYEEDYGVELEGALAVETEAGLPAETEAGLPAETEAELPAVVEDEVSEVALEVEGEAAGPVLEETPAEAEEAAEPAAEAEAEALDVKAAWLDVEDFVPVDEDVEEEPQVKPELPAWLEEAEQAEAQAAPEVEAWVPPVEALPVAPVRAPSGSPRSVPVDLNKAGLVDLERLPGVGFTLAQKILDQRDQIGPFNSVMDLGQIPGITPDILQELEGLVTVEPPKPSITAPHLRVEGPDDLLAARQAFLNGDAEGALEQYGKLIRQRRFLPDIVRDLEKAAEANPRLAEIWQVLGDAYLRDDQLQPALEAYTKVEELLR